MTGNIYLLYIAIRNIVVTDVCISNTVKGMRVTDISSDIKVILRQHVIDISNAFIEV